MQVGDTLIGIHHTQLRTLAVTRLNIGFDGSTLLFWQMAQFPQQITQTVIWINAQLIKGFGVFFKHIREEYRYRMTKDDRIGYFHHGGFQVHRQQYTLLTRIFKLTGKKFTQCLTAHH